MPEKVSESNETEELLCVTRVHFGTIYISLIKIMYTFTMNGNYKVKGSLGNQKVQSSIFVDEYVKAHKDRSPGPRVFLHRV